MNIFQKFWAWLKGWFTVSPSVEEPAPNEVPVVVTEEQKVPIEVPVPATEVPTEANPVVPFAPDLGFDPCFLPMRVDLPALPDDSSILLPYLHYSVALNPARRMPYFTAVNIDAERYNQLKAQIPSRKDIGADRWILDDRIPKEVQLPASFYRDNDFDLGHMVRREDVLWGDNVEQALAANNATFYLTNATPQHKDFNRNAQRWKGLEDYALKNARQNNLRVSVFSGCIFREDDRKHKMVQIPGKFWKVLVMVKANGELSATGYVIQQDDLIQDITEREIGFQYEQFKTYQVPITQIEAATGLQFQLNAYDPMQKIATRGVELLPMAIDDFADVLF